jgi:protein dithiol:quinone oxidoreductase
MIFFPSRIINLLGLVACVFLLVVGFYLQYVEGIQPCLLCTVQRLVFFLLTLIFLIAILHNPRHRGIRIYGLFTTLLGILGTLIASRHIWLQMHPQHSGVCLPGLTYIFSNLSLSQTWEVLLHGSDDCSRIYLVLGLSIPTWSLIGFIALSVLGVWQMVFPRRSSNH